MCPNDTPVSSIKQEVVTVGKRAARPALDTSDMVKLKSIVVFEVQCKTVLSIHCMDVTPA